MATAVLLAERTNVNIGALFFFIVTLSDVGRPFLVFSGNECFIARLVLVHHLRRFLLREAHGVVVRWVAICSLIDIAFRLGLP